MKSAASGRTLDRAEIVARALAGKIHFDFWTMGLLIINMTGFQKKCVDACQGFADMSLGASLNFQEKIGAEERFLIGRLDQGLWIIEIFVYVNEAGFMVNGKEWVICEHPDYDSDDKLIAALIDKLKIYLKINLPGERRK